LSIKSINAIAHFTDWIVAHVHVGGLGWNGFLTFGMLYWMIPKMWKTNLFSVKLANFHFWIGTLGIVFYALPMYWAGVTQSLMWQEFNANGQLQYANFLETVVQIVPLYMVRALGGALYLTGAIVMTYNLAKTMAQGSFLANEDAEAYALEKDQAPKGKWHHVLESRPIQFTILTTVAILIGGILELVPTFLIKSNVPTIASVKPYTPLELEGRDIYIREGCVSCHTQMVRPFRDETLRYQGEYSKAGEFVYDHPFLWGSKRTGPDLHRVGRKYLDSWHYQHMLDPTSMSPGSLMPPYPWLFEQTLNAEKVPDKIRVMKKLGVPYQDGYESIAVDDLNAQAQQISKRLKEELGIEVMPELEIVALISYLQRLGTDIKGNPTASISEITSKAD
jgi:cytochrome c oxidase cbb3-type subunit I/II